MSDFLGKDGRLYWWVGEIMNRMDPLNLHRCQVKIFGWHDDGNPNAKLQIPVTDLPWAQPLIPCNNGTSVSLGTPQIGDWVVGFFMDGPSGQVPIMWGVLPAFNPSEEDKKSFNTVQDQNS